MEERYCLECGTKLIGRIDKKFCSDQCRNTYNNRMNRDENLFMTKVNRILRKNRKILKELNPNGKAKVHKSKMVSLGFEFKYFTHVYKTKEGRVYYFCYEYGYLPLDHDYFALVVNKEI
jgi:predicted nucleic acid-binding Zn ribbon protein